MSKEIFGVFMDVFCFKKDVLNIYEEAYCIEKDTKISNRKPLKDKCAVVKWRKLGLKAMLSNYGGQ
jgi:hypothetical protein